MKREVYKLGTIRGQIGGTVSCFVKALRILTQRTHVVAAGSCLKHCQRLVDRLRSMVSVAHSTAWPKPTLLTGAPTIARFSGHVLFALGLSRRTAAYLGLDFQWKVIRRWS